MAELTKWFLAYYGPATDNSYDLGAALFRWKNFYLAGNATIGGTVTVASIALTTATNFVFNNDELISHNDDVVFT